MILADKIIRLRKKNGWSQEDLADKMNVSRQAVSKWEGAQSTPDLGKIVQMSELFGVSTDYLLKDEIEMEAFTEDSPLDYSRRHVSMEQANDYLRLRQDASLQIAIATFICVVAAVPLLLLEAMAETRMFSIRADAAAGVGLIVLLVLVAGAVAIFLYTGFKAEPYEFLEKEPFETDFGVSGMVREKQDDFRSLYSRMNIIATCICVLSPIPLFAGLFLHNEFLMIVMLTITMALAGLGAAIFIVAGVQWESMEKLLQEGEFTVDEKKNTRVKEAVATIYWLSATVIYLGWSFWSDQWERTWIVWPVAGVLYAVVISCVNLALKAKNE